MDVSVIIPTYNRDKDLKVTLNSLLHQTTLPKEVLIVDDSDSDIIKNTIKSMKKHFDNVNVLLRYIRNPKERSIPIARNVGVENATGDILLFLDDDVILDSEYIYNLLDVYKNNRNAKGVQGYIVPNFRLTSMNLLVNAISRIFFLFHLEKDGARVLPSTNNTYPLALTKTISCQWLSGCNHSYLRSVFKEFQYDEKLKRYSFKEDIDLSYRVFRKYPGSLYITPKAKLIHKWSQTARMPKKSLIYIQSVYSLYLFYKDIEQTFENRLIFFWSKIGEFLFLLFRLAITKPRKSMLLNLKYWIEAQILCVRYRKRIRRGHIEHLVL